MTYLECPSFIECDAREKAWPIYCGKEDLAHKILFYSSVSTAIVKVTQKCNLACSYCYENKTAGEDMKIEVFKKLAKAIIYNSQRKNITFTFHGGEPTLLPIEWFEEAVHFGVTEGQKNGKFVTFAIQSNLVNMNSDILSAFHKLNIKLGGSIDGLPDFSSMRPGTEKAINNYLIAKQLGINISLLVTINHFNFSNFTEIMRWLDRELKVKSFKANPIYSVGAGYNLPSLQADQIFKAQRDIIDYMIWESNYQIVERNSLEAIHRFVEKGNAARNLCNKKKCGAGSEVIGINPDGKILPCGRFAWSERTFQLGDIQGISDSDFDQKKFIDFHSSFPENWTFCNTCEAKHICNYGCQAFIIRSNKHINIECEPTKLMYAYFLKNEKSILNYWSNFKKQCSDSVSKQVVYNYSDYGGGYSDGGGYFDN